MAITSINGEIEGSVLTFNRDEVVGTGRGDLINVYLDFTLAGAETVSLQVACVSEELDAEIYTISELVSGTITPITLSLSATGKYVVPVTIPKDADIIHITVSGLTTSDLNINIGLDNYYA